MSDEIAFEPFQKIARISRQVVVTEKIDGTNGQIFIDDLSTTIRAGSRSQWIDLKADNFGFARWVEENKVELMKLGPGAHYGEWWGAGVQRRYGLKEKRFSLFNAARWGDGGKDLRPSCCHVVPVLWTGNFNDLNLGSILEALAREGSRAAPGFMDPEGVVIWHEAARVLFKKTIKGDEKPKGSTETA
jgi:hypothetical protein